MSTTAKRRIILTAIIFGPSFPYNLHLGGYSTNHIFAVGPQAELCELSFLVHTFSTNQFVRYTLPVNCQLMMSLIPIVKQLMTSLIELVNGSQAL